MLQRLSIKARVTLFATAILIAVVLLLAVFSGRLLRADTERLIGEQQLSMIKLIAAQVDERVQDRTRALASVASGGIAELMADPQKLQARLEQREVLTRLFNRGGFVVDRSGIAVASVPTDLGRVGLRYGDRESFLQIMAGAKSVVSTPVIGKPSGTPVFGMAVPIKSSSGDTVGVLYGATDLGLPNFLDIVTSNRIGMTGGYFVIDPQSRRILGATDRSRLMESLPKTGVNPTVDAFAANDEASAVLVNAKGVEVLSSIKSIPAAGWQLVASIPMAELEEPIVTTRSRLIIAALFLTALAAGFMWLTVRRELAPVQTAAKQLAGAAGQSAHSLTINRPDEVGELFAAFNHQLAALKAREDALARTSRLARIGGWEMYPATDTRVWSEEILRILEIDPPVPPASFDEVMKYYAPEVADQVVAAHVAAIEQGTPWDIEVPMITATGRHIWARVQGIAERVDGVTVKLLGTLHDITERKALEAELAAQRDFAHQTFTSMGQGLSVTDANGLLLFVNPALATMLGAEADELIGKSAHDLVIAEDAAVHQDQVAQRSSGVSAAYVVRVKRGDGTTARVTINGSPRFKDGKFDGVVSIITDLTESDRLQSELDAQREFDRQVIASMGQGLSVTDASGAFQLVNPALAKLLGYSAQELIGKQSNDYVYAEDRDLNARYRKERRDGKVDQYFVRLVRANGSSVKVSVSGTPQYVNGTYIGAVTVITDLTESDRLQNELQEQRDFGNYVLNAMGQGLTIVGADGRFEFCNPAYAAIVGCDVSDIVGKTPDDVTYPPDREEQVVQAQNRRAGLTSTYEVRFPRPDGSFVYASITGTPRFKDGAYAGSIAVVTDLTERKLIEAALEQQRDFAESILRNMGQGVGVSNAEGRFEYINPAYGRLLGWDPQEFIGKTVDDITPGEDIAFVNEQRQLRKSGVTNTYLTRVLRRDGSVVSVAVTATPRLHDGRYGGAIAVVTDLTERNAMEQDLKDQRDFAESIVNSMEQGVGVTDLDGRFEFVNAAYADLLGYDAQTLVGRALEDFLVEQDKIELRDRLRERSEGLSATYESRRIRADGQTVPVLVTASPRYVKGKNVGSIAVITNLSEQRAAQRALAESEFRFKSLMEDISTIAVQGYKMDGTVVFWNRASERLYGFSAAEAMGKNLLDLVIPAEMREGVKEAIAEMARTGEVEPSAELVLQRKDGSKVPVYSTHALTMRDGHVNELFCLDIDLTEQKRAEAMRETLEERLRQSQKMEAIGTLAGGIAHDFNNILATILGNVELAQHAASLDPEVRVSLTEIRKAGSRARDLVGQILSFSRRQATVLKSLDLSAVVAESVRLLRSTLPGHITLTVRSEAVPVVVGDTTQLQQVIMNLATNSMQAIGPRKGEIVISLDAIELSDTLSHAEPQLQELVTLDGKVIRLIVADNGPGMDEDTLPHLFEPFFTTKAVNEGTGLGLAVVHGIIKGHGGVINVKSAVGEGTVFTIYFSASGQSPDPSAETSANVSTQTATDAATPLAVAAHIMYIDDDEALVFLMTRLLERRGFRVSAFTDQRAALDALRADPNGVSLLVTDYNMPGMSGLDVAREARDIRRDLPIAVASGFVDEKLQTMAEEAGVRELIFKANVTEEFCNTVERLVRDRLH